MRKLATIQKVISLNPIPDADAIEVAQILGWKVVVKKGEFKVGDLCVYCEIDSLLPERPEFEFLRNSKFRIRTVKLRGQISQGICFPLSVLKQGDWDFGIIKINPHEAKNIACIRNTKTDLLCGGIELVEGANVTDVLGIEKYEAPIPAELAGDAKGALPSYFQVTDEDRIQILPHIPEQYCGKSFIATEKLDGSSCSFFWRNGEFGVCGRNWEYKESPTNSMWKFARQNYLEEKLGVLGRNLALQGEIIGEGIQKNRYKIKGQTVRFFRVFDIDKYEYLPYDEMIALIKELKLETVPVLDINYILPATVDEILAYAQGNSALNPQTGREGVVFVRYEKSNQGRLSFKAISNKFLLDNKE
jgi:RNA ligase (TIGR02306 family)